MQIEIWSDVVCPWCYIGKRRLEQALERFDHRDSVEIVYRSFELDPSTRVGARTPIAEYLGAKYGGGRAAGETMTARVVEVAESVGLDFHYDEVVRGNTFAAHRLLHLALAERGPAMQGALKERLLAAYFVDGAFIDDHDVLSQLAISVGLPVQRVTEVLASDEFADDVRADVAQARAFGANGVPFFVIDRTYGISGAQPVELFDQALAEAWAARPAPLVRVGASQSHVDGEVCGPDGCPV